MTRLTEAAMLCGVSTDEIRIWIAESWVLPAHSPDDDWHFSDVDLARARLIRELEQDLGVNHDAMPVVLSLLDQVHGLRRRLRALARGMADLSEEQRRRFLAVAEAPEPR